MPILNYKVIGTVDDKDHTLSALKSLSMARKWIDAFYDDVETQSYLDYDEVFIRTPTGEELFENEDGKWVPV